MFAERLKLARSRKGISLRDLAAVLGHQVTAQAISKYEAGAMLPNSKLLVDLSKALDVSLDFLMGGEVLELNGVEFRSRAGTTSSDRAAVQQSVIDHVERYLSIEQILSLNSEVQAVGIRGLCNVRTTEEAEKCADELRGRWQLGFDPIPSMTALLEEKGFKVIEIDLPEKVDGLTCWARRISRQPDVPVIVVSKSRPFERRRFTLSHELGHEALRGSPIEELEKASNRFAAAFLMPRAHLQAELGKHRKGLAYEELVRLKHFYGVAAAALLMRLKDIGIINDATLSYAFQTYARSWRKTEPSPIDRDGTIKARFERPERFERLVYRALAERLISLPKAASLLKTSISCIELAMKGPADADSSYRQ